MRNTVVPVKCIFRPVAGGSEPIRKSLKAGPVCVPPPSHCPTTQSPSAIKSAVPQKLRSGNALRKSVMNALMSSRPRRGSCREYCRSMSGAASSSTTPRLQVLPQNSVNHRPTMALLSSALLIRIPFLVCVAKPPIAIDDLREGNPGCRRTNSVSCRDIENHHRWLPLSSVLINAQIVGPLQGKPENMCSLRDLPDLTPSRHPRVGGTY